MKSDSTTQGGRRVSIALLMLAAVVAILQAQVAGPLGLLVQDRSGAPLQSSAAGYGDAASGLERRSQWNRRR